GVRDRDREGLHGREELHAPEHRAAVRCLSDHDDARVRAPLLRRRIARRDEVGRRQLGEAEGRAVLVARGSAPRGVIPVARSTAALRVITDPRPRPALPSAVLGMLIFVSTEVMLFAGLVSAFLILRATAAGSWPPPGQPRLPLEETALNTAAL